MGNSVIVYRSQREKMMDEFWMSEDGSTVGMILVLFFVGALGVAKLYEMWKWHRRGIL